MAKLEIAPGLVLPLEAVTWTFSILAMRGAGKSNVAVVMAEEMHKAGLHWIAVDPKGDWWGIQSSADGKEKGLSVPVFGGEHGNVRIYAESGAELADYLIEQGISAVIDLSEMTKTEMSKFLGGPDFSDKGKVDGFFARLYKRKSRNQAPTHLFLEEVDEYLPQQVTSGIAKLHYDGQKVSTKGRFRGLGATCATQRPARFHNDVLTQTDNLIAMRNMAPPELKQVKLWVDFHGQSKEIVQSLPSLQDGEGWFVSPNKMKRVELVRFHRRETLDTGATPEVVVRGKRRPPTLADIDIPAVETALRETIERAKAEDPAELRKEIARLRKELNARRTEPTEIEVPVEVPVALLEPQEAERIDGVLATISSASEKLGRIAEEFDRRLTSVGGPSTSQRVEKIARRVERQRMPREVVRTEMQKDTSDIKLKAGARRMLSVLAGAPMKVTRPQLASLSGMKRTGGGFQTYFSMLKTNGLIVEEGGVIRLTDAGADVVGTDFDAPTTTAEVLEMWGRKLRGGARRMLAVLVEEYPEILTRAELAERVEMEPMGGAFQTYLSTLKTNELIVVRGSEVCAKPETLLL